MRNDTAQSPAGGYEHLHIVHVVPKSSGGGAELLVRELSNRQSNKGAVVQAVYYCRLQRDELRTFECSLGLSNSRSLHAVFKLRRELTRFIRQSDGRGSILVHLHLTWGLLYGVLACVGLPVKLVYTEHNTSNKYRAIPGARYVFGEFYKRLDQIVCISKGVDESLAEWLPRSAGGTPRKIIVNGARLMQPPKHGRKPVAGRGLRLVAVGSLTYRKGFDLLVRAAARDEEYLERLVIVGEGEDGDTLKALAEDLGVRAKCDFVGWQSDIEPWLQEADGLVMSSRWEGFGLVAVEAMSTGLPIIAPRLPGISEVVSGSGVEFLYTAGSELELSAAVVRLHQSLSDGASYQRAAVDRASEFSLDRMATRYLDVYSSVAN